MMSIAFTLQKEAYLQGFLVSDFAFMRGFMGLLFITPLMYYYGEGFFSSVPREFRRTMFLRSCLGSVSIFFYNFSFYYLPLSQIVVIKNIYPFVASFFGYLINGEKVEKMEIVGLLVCFTGIIMFAISKSLKEDGKEEVSQTEFWYGVCSILTSSMAMGMIVPLVRKMKGIHFIVISNWANMTNTLFFFLFALADFDNFTGNREKISMEAFYLMLLAVVILVF